MSHRRIAKLRADPPNLFYQMLVRAGLAKHNDWSVTTQPERITNVIASDLETAAPYSDLDTNRDVGPAPVY